MLPWGPIPFLQPPQKIMRDIQRGRMPSGQIVEIRRTEMTIFENGVLRKEMVVEIDPGLADGRSTDTVRDIGECHVCVRLFHRDNISCCAVCGRDFCRSQECGGEITPSPEERVAVCRTCADEGNRSVLKQIFRRFWGFE